MSSYQLESRPFPALPEYHQGTGTVAGSWVVVDPDSVNQDVNSQLKFSPAKPYKLTVMSLEIATSQAPNWFAVSFRRGINTFDTVNIFCHPFPTKGMADKDYPTRGGEWPRVFRYAELIGRQIDIAHKNHITIVPIFTSATYESTGILAANWKDIVEQILAFARDEASNPETPDGKARAAYTPVERLETFDGTRKKGSPPAVDPAGRLQHVVLSDFSHGRQLMANVRKRLSGIDRFLREIWDFDGVHAPVPVSPRAIVYENLSKSGSASPTNFYVPPSRWLNWHHKVLEPKQLHGDVPARLACHAATISNVGKAR